MKNKETSSLQEILNNAMAVDRQESLKHSPQILLGELILKLESITADKYVYFDFNNMYPKSIDSWRGSYNELAISYTNDEKMMVAQLLSILKGSIGKTFTGYKGGEFVMGKGTPIWVANYSEDSIEAYKGKDGFETVGIIDVKEYVDKVTLITTVLIY